MDKALNTFLKYLEDNENETSVLAAGVIDLAEAIGPCEPLDLYRGFLKLAFSVLNGNGVPVRDEVADFVHGSDDWKAAAGHVNLTFKAVKNLVHFGVGAPQMSPAVQLVCPSRFKCVFLFGWFGIEYVYFTEEQVPDSMPRWSLTTIEMADAYFEPEKFYLR
ncbi:MAG: hypothetical protein ACTH30_10555 [Leucobacter sp.]